jgi:hypothetical protein
MGSGSLQGEVVHPHHGMHAPFTRIAENKRTTKSNSATAMKCLKQST